MRRWFLLSAALAAVAFAPPASATVPTCATLDMTVSAQLSSDPGFEGLYKYTVTGCWDVSQYGLSHIDFFLQLKDLECICDPRVIKFPTPGGTSDGVSDEGACKVTYTGKYNCMGDPTVPAELKAPTVKFTELSLKSDSRRSSWGGCAIPGSPTAHAWERTWERTSGSSSPTRSCATIRRPARTSSSPMAASASRPTRRRRSCTSRANSREPAMVKFFVEKSLRGSRRRVRRPDAFVPNDAGPFNEHP